MTKLTDNLYAVEVLHSAYFIKLRFSKFITCRKEHSSVIVYPKDGLWELVGIVTPDSIDFDCEPYLSDNTIVYLLDENSGKPFAGFDITKDKLFNPESSFRSLLTSAGLTDYSKLVIIKSK